MNFIKILLAYKKRDDVLVTYIEVLVSLIPLTYMQVCDDFGKWFIEFDIHFEVSSNYIDFFRGPPTLDFFFLKIICHC